MKTARPKRTRLRAAAKAVPETVPDAALDAVETAIGYGFRDRPLLARALTHPSALAGERITRHSYQRLEFLGDRVLGLVVAERLYARRRGEREGSLAGRLNRLVNKAACAEAARHLGLGPYIAMSSHEIEAGGRERESTLGDVCEAVIGAVYLDGGLAKARAVIDRAFAPQFAVTPERIKDPKTLLQEWAQGEGRGMPHYRVLSREGPDHAPQFEIEVEVEGAGEARGTGRSKQEGERAAAEALLDRLERDNGA